MCFPQGTSGRGNPHESACRIIRKYEWPGLQTGKSIYGRKQAPRAWNKKLSTDLKRLGFKALVSAESVFKTEKKGHVVYLVYYIEDILIITKSKNALHTVKAELATLYQVQDLGKVNIFLRIKTEREQGHATLSQEHYIDKILDRFGVTDCKSAPSPMVSPDDLMIKRKPSVDEAAEMAGVPYRAAIGSLVALSINAHSA